MIPGTKELTFRILEGLSPEEVSAFVKLCKRNKYADGTCLFRKRTEARTFYLVLAGSIELRYELPGGRQEDVTLIARQGPGVTVGWSVLIPPYILGDLVEELISDKNFMIDQLTGYISGSTY